MRYIHILSDLSNQIRYASQKRVLVEVTLIKLCKPQMDEKQDFTTLSSRLAAVERQLEQGIPAAGKGSSPQAEPETGQKEPENPKCIGAGRASFAVYG